MIVNIGTKIDLMEAHFSTLLPLIDIFEDRIYAWKPAATQSGMTLYFSEVTNSELVGSDNTYKSTFKRAVFDFVIITNKKDTPDVVLYEHLDKVSNEICWKGFSLWEFKVFWIQEGNQSGVVEDEGENPLIVAQYAIDYKSIY